MTTQRIDEEVSVDGVIPKSITWRNRVYHVVKIGLHHTYCRGRTLYHVFSVVTHTLFLRLVLNTDNLHWVLEEVTTNDGEL